MVKRLCCALLALFAFSGAIAQQTATKALLSAAAVSGPQVPWVGEEGVFIASGTWNGATVTLVFVGPDGSQLIPAGAGTTCNANCVSVFILPFGSVLQAVVSGAGGSTSLYATVSTVPQ